MSVQDRQYNKFSMPQKSEALERKRNSYSLLAPWHWRKPWEAKGSQGPLHESNVCALRGIGDAAPHLLPLEDAKNSPRQVQHPHSVSLRLNGDKVRSGEVRQQACAAIGAPDFACTARSGRSGWFCVSRRMGSPPTRSKRVAYGCLDRGAARISAVI